MSTKPTVYIAENSLSCTDTEIELISRFVPQYRIERAERYHRKSDRNNSIISYFLLAYGLLVNFGTESIPDVVYGRYGKPEFKDFPVNFSISHSEVSVCCGISEGGIGTDVQEMIDSYGDIIETVMSEGERKIIESTAGQSPDFTRFWTLKECYLKYKGTGIGDNLPCTDFSGVSGNCFEYRGVFFRTQNSGNYFISACSENETPVFVRKSIREYISGMGYYL